MCRVLGCAQLMECGDLSPLLDGPLHGVPGEVRIGAKSGDETPGRPNKAAMNRRSPKVSVVSITSSNVLT